MPHRNATEIFTDTTQNDILFGIIIYRERLTWNLRAGIITFMTGLILLATLK
ncbi:MAG TPA: hypothetical protein VGD98_23495 [Ktedonobacteraceae bacterium]